jgi:hypothetical protein
MVRVCFFRCLKTATATRAIRIAANATETNRIRFDSENKPVGGDEDGVGVGGGNAGSVLTK